MMFDWISNCKATLFSKNCFKTSPYRWNLSSTTSRARPEKVIMCSLSKIDKDCLKIIACSLKELLQTCLGAATVNANPSIPVTNAFKSRPISVSFLIRTSLKEYHSQAGSTIQTCSSLHWTQVLCIGVLQ